MLLCPQKRFSAIRFYVMDGTGFRYARKTACKGTVFFRHTQEFRHKSFKKVYFEANNT